MKSRIITAVICGLLIAGAACSVTSAKPSASVQYVCKEGPDEKCPDSADYVKLKSFQDKYKAPTSEQDEVNGLWMRLNQNPPPGFHWDGAKLLYVKNPPPVPSK